MHYRTLRPCRTRYANVVSSHMSSSYSDLRGVPGTESWVQGAPMEVCALHGGCCAPPSFSFSFPCIGTVCDMDERDTSATSKPSNGSSSASDSDSVGDADTSRGRHCMLPLTAPASSCSWSLRASVLVPASRRSPVV
eukprot:m.165468 g.165468  ORF g.165468 m.165468 type:complete len:137 (-) comp12565_c0_seq1:1489-1899(-)